MDNQEFKVGDRVKCIIDAGVLFKVSLTLNKTYTVTKIKHYGISNCIFIKDDDGCIDFYSERRFIKVGCLKYKIRKLKRLLNK